MNMLDPDSARISLAIDCFDQLVAALTVAELALERATPLQQPYAQSRAFHFKARMEVRAALEAAGAK